MSEFTPSSSNNSHNQIDYLDFDPLFSLEDQSELLENLQRQFQQEWINDPSNFGAKWLDRVPHDFPMDKGVNSVNLGLQHEYDATGVVTERIVVHLHNEQTFDSLTAGLPPRIQKSNRYIVILSTKNGEETIPQYFNRDHAELVKGQINRLKDLKRNNGCPNISEDLMTIITNLPGKDITRPWRSVADLSRFSD